MSAEAEQALQALIAAESRLLDDWQLDDWLALFDSDSTYWVPIDETSDPRVAPSIIYEDRASLAVRVEQLMRHKRLAQTPRSELLHQVSNIELALEGEHASARYSLVVFEARGGDWRQSGLGAVRFHAGRCLLRFVRRHDQWRIAEKRVVLLDRQLPLQQGLSYLI